MRGRGPWMEARLLAGCGWPDCGSGSGSGHRASALVDLVVSEIRWECVVGCLVLPCSNVES
jgi:hypothetical protein